MFGQRQPTVFCNCPSLSLSAFIDLTDHFKIHLVNVRGRCDSCLRPLLYYWSKRHILKAFDKWQTRITPLFPTLLLIYRIFTAFAKTMTVRGATHSCVSSSTIDQTIIFRVCTVNVSRKHDSCLGTLVFYWISIIVLLSVALSICFSMFPYLLFNCSFLSLITWILLEFVRSMAVMSLFPSVSFIEQPFHPFRIHSVNGRRSKDPRLHSYLCHRISVNILSPSLSTLLLVFFFAVIVPFAAIGRTDFFRNRLVNGNRRYDSCLRLLFCHWISVISPFLCHYPPSPTHFPFLSQYPCLFPSRLWNSPPLSLIKWIILGFVRSMPIGDTTLAFVVPCVIDRMNPFRNCSSMEVGGKTHDSMTIFFIESLSISLVCLLFYSHLYYFAILPLIERIVLGFTEFLLLCPSQSPWMSVSFLVSF